MLSLIVAMDEDGLIGVDNRIPWDNKEDRKYFRHTTIGSTVVMGRRTFESIGHELPCRTNIVMTRNRGYILPASTTCSFVAHSTLKVFKLHSLYGKSKNSIHIIGGTDLYSMFIYSVQTISLTVMKGHFKERNEKIHTFFPLPNHLLKKYLAEYFLCSIEHNTEEFDRFSYERVLEDPRALEM